MAATASAWGKPGAWALEAEEHDAMEVLRQQEAAAAAAAAPLVETSSDFPSLAAAASTKIQKKKKGQTVSLAEFNNGGVPVTHGSGKFQVRAMTASVSPLVQPSKGLTPDERLMLPTAPRERTAEELELGNSRGFNNYYAGGRSRGNGGEDSVSRWDSSRASDENRKGGFGSGGPGSNRDLAPSRADEVDDWGANKRPVAPAAERRERSGGFFESQTRADDHDSWVSNKSVPPPLPENRRTGDGFRERRGFDMFNKDASSDSWGRRKEESGGERPRLKLQPRTLPIEKIDVERNQTSKPSLNSNEEIHSEEVKPVAKSKGTNPFGAARPREEVLAEKGQDWKQIDERLESTKMREEAQPLSKKGFGLGVGSESVDKTERAWRKMEPVEPPTTDQSDQIVERESAAADS